MNFTTILQLIFDVFIYLIIGATISYLLKFAPESSIEYQGKTRFAFNLEVRTMRIFAIVIFPFILAVMFKELFVEDYHALRQQHEIDKLTANKLENLIHNQSFRVDNDR